MPEAPVIPSLEGADIAIENLSLGSLEELSIAGEGAAGHVFREESGVAAEPFGLAIPDTLVDTGLGVQHYHLTMLRSYLLSSTQKQQRVPVQPVHSTYP